MVLSSPTYWGRWGCLSRLRKRPEWLALADTTTSWYGGLGHAPDPKCPLRTYEGRQEVDFIVETGDGVIGLEAKLGNTVKDSDVRHLRWLREMLGDDCIDVAVLNTGRFAFCRQDGSP